MARQVLGGRESVRVAAVQAAPVFMDREKTVEKACRLIGEADAGGANLVVFSETFIPTYPAYYTGVPSAELMDYNIALQDNSIVIPGDETVALGEAARQAGVYVVIGCNELDERPGSRTLYNTMLFIGRDGSVLGRHRKLMPTYNERLYWGLGDGSDLRVYETDIGMLGGLICWEHHIVLARAAVIQMGVELHVAVWPGTWRGGAKAVEADPVMGGSCDLQPVIRAHAFEAGAFVISVSGLLREEDMPQRWSHLKDSPKMNYSWAVGGSAIVAPSGNFLVEPKFDEETILYADCQANAIKAAKALFDAIGHYARPDIFRLEMKASGRGFAPALEVSRDDLRRISEQFEIGEDELRAIVAELNGGHTP